MNLLDLPNEIIYEIFGYLVEDIHSVRNLKLTCKRLSEFDLDNILDKKYALAGPTIPFHKRIINPYSHNWEQIAYLLYRKRLEANVGYLLRKSYHLLLLDMITTCIRSHRLFILTQILSQNSLTGITRRALKRASARLLSHCERCNRIYKSLNNLPQ